MGIYGLWVTVLDYTTQVKYFNSPAVI